MLLSGSPCIADSLSHTTRVETNGVQKTEQKIQNLGLDEAMQH